MFKIVTLIRANFGLTVAKMEDDEFVELASQALWLEKYRGEVLKGAIAEVLYNAMGGGAS